MPVKKEQLKKLQDPKIYEDLGIKPKWRLRQVKDNIAYCVPYHDARDVQRVLDHVCGSDNWANEPLDIGGKLYMNISINIDGEGWISKADVGTESNIEKTKGQASDALKRAAVMWGIFRDVYEMGEMRLNGKGKYAVTAQGKVLGSGDMLSAYCNGMNTETGKLLSIYKAFKGEFETHPEAKEHLTALNEFLKTIKE